MRLREALDQDQASGSAARYADVPIAPGLVHAYRFTFGKATAAPGDLPGWGLVKAARDRRLSSMGLTRCCGQPLLFLGGSGVRLMNIDRTMTLAVVAVWCATACTSSPGDKRAVPGRGASMEASRPGLAPPQAVPVPDSATRAAAASQPSAPSPDYSALIIDLRSAPRSGVDAPAALLVTTPDGRRAGLDTSAHRIVTEIEGGGVDSSCPDEIDEAVRLNCTPAGHVELQRPDSGMYTIGVIGVREGAYALTVLGYDAAGNAPQIDSIAGTDITPGEVHRYQLRVAKVLPNVIVLSRDSVGAPR